MTHTQILHLDGRRELAETQVLIEGEGCSDCTWEIKVQKDGSLYVSRHGGFCFDVRPISPSKIQLVRRKL